ncbi:hypothetical protein GCK32_012323 [Trichostrongylus colubriformis]|uniref:Uncharacterized protein n=1 Tax=Trichostrongylus colubriformis TaxID=6319 RepID=A0AAN8FE74_TRICO
MLTWRDNVHHNHFQLRYHFQVVDWLEKYTGLALDFVEQKSMAQGVSQAKSRKSCTTRSRTYSAEVSQALPKPRRRGQKNY